MEDINLSVAMGAYGVSGIGVLSRSSSFVPPTPYHHGAILPARRGRRVRISEPQAPATRSHTASEVPEEAVLGHAYAGVQPHLGAEHREQPASYDNGDFLADGILGMDEVHSRLDTGAFKVGKAFNRPLVNLHKRETGSVSRASNGKLAFDPRRKRLRCARRRGGPRPRCTA